MKDKYGAVWVSHSSMGDFLKCQRLYFLHNVYKNPDTGRKITIVNPALSLGSAVHATLEALKILPVEERLCRDLLADFEKEWMANAAGKKGGFTDNSEEATAKARGRAMIERVMKNPGPIAKKTVKLKESENNMPPNFVLDEDENIVLCGVIDWLEYVEADDSIRIIDFKTGKNEENDNSLQLPIYLLLLNALQKRRVSGAAYWYLEKNDAPTEVALPDAVLAREKVLALARRVKDAREKKAYECPRGSAGCFACQPYETVKHPTQKPFELSRRLIRSAMPKKDGVVLVPFVGTGSECKIAKELGHSYLGFEINPDYVKMAEKFVQGK